MWTLYDLRNKLIEDTHNQRQHGHAEADGDGATTQFPIAPPGRRVVNDGLLTCTVNGVADTTGTMDYNTGIYTFVAAPADGADIVWEFQYVYWTDEQVDHAINVAIQACYPELWVPKTEDVITDGSAREYSLATANVDVVLSLAYSSDGTTFTPWAVNKRIAQWGPDIEFFSAPTAGTVRFRLACRPAWMDDISDQMDLPDRAVGPVVAHACWQLLTQKQAPRTYSDIVIHNLGVGTLSPRQMNDAGNAFYMQFQMELQKIRMHPWKVR